MTGVLCKVFLVLLVLPDLRALQVLRGTSGRVDPSGRLDLAEREEPQADGAGRGPKGKLASRVRLEKKRLGAGNC